MWAVQNVLRVARVKNSVLCYKTSCSLVQNFWRSVTATWCRSPYVQYNWAPPSERRKGMVVPVRAMTADVCHPSFLTLALDGREWSTLPLPDGPARSLVVNFLSFYRKWEARNKTSGLIILRPGNFLWKTRTLVLAVVQQRHLLASTHNIVVTRFYHQPPLQPWKRPFNVTNHHEFQKISPKLNCRSIKQQECCWHTSPYLTVLDVHLSLT